MDFTRNSFIEDFKEHNKEVNEVWDSFHAGDPIRMPVIVDTSDRYYVLNRTTNPRNISFREYSGDPRVMFELQKGFEPYFRTQIPGDHEMGLPADGWYISVDFQNYYEAAWLGAEVAYPDNQVPYARQLLNDDNKYMLFEKGIPDPFSGFLAKARDYYDQFTEWQKDTLIEGLPVKHIGVPFCGTDGMFTLACELRGAGNICIDMMEEPDYYHQLMDYLTEATIRRLKAWHIYRGEEPVHKSYGFADDSIMLLSKDQYREFVLPYHKRLLNAMCTMEEKNFCHLCGDATRHFALIRDELNVGGFDTGYPVNHRELVLEMGPDITIQGGVPSDVVYGGTPEQIDAMSKKIIESVKLHTKKFIFRDANNIAPYTSVRNMLALYEAGIRYGRYRNH
ncbi:MAG: uroporphyrinogen decarboxylase family protein [Saccharofermentanales bacterium]